MAAFTTIAPVYAQDEADNSAATATIASFDDTLLSTMKDAGKLGYKGRFERMAPVIDKTFNLPLMTRLLVGPEWNTLSADKQAELLAEFRRFTIGTYANRFDGYNGEKINIVSVPQDQKSDMLIQTELVPQKGEPVKLNYLLRKGDHGWQVIDIFLEGTISQLATQRSEFQSVLSAAGVDGLITQLDKKSAPAENN
jgi:phospholipid transport system substrate-binding protein